MSADAPPSAFPFRLATLRRHQSTVLLFFASEAVAQAINAVSGIIVVRTLTRADLALFTIAAAFQATVSVLADTGVSTAVMALGGQRWNQPRALASLIATALRFRRSVGAVVIALAIPTLIASVIHFGAPIAGAVLIAAWLIATIALQIDSGVHSAVPRLLGRVKHYQITNFASAVIRLSAIGALALVHGLTVWSALMANLLAIAIYAFLLRSLSKAALGTRGEFSDLDHRAIKSYAITQAPNAIFYCLQGQLVVWLVAIFGSTGRVADVGALARVAVVFSIFMAFLQTVVVPGLARIRPTEILQRTFILLTLACGGFTLLIVGAGALFSRQILWLIGPKYSHLQAEVVLILLCGSLQVVDSALQGFNVARGWVKWYWINIPILISLQAALILLLNVSSVYNAIAVRTIAFLPGIALSTLIAIHHLRHRSLGDHEHVPAEVELATLL